LRRPVIFLTKNPRTCDLTVFAAVSSFTTNIAKHTKIAKMACFPSEYHDGFELQLYSRHKKCAETSFLFRRLAHQYSYLKRPKPKLLRPIKSKFGLNSIYAPIGLGIISNNYVSSPPLFINVTDPYMDILTNNTLTFRMRRGRSLAALGMISQASTNQ